MNLARGHFEEVRNDDGSLHVRGWMLVPTSPLDELVVHIDGAPRQTCAPIDRQDVRDVYRHVRHAGRTGFDFRIDDTPAAGQLEIEGRLRGRSVARLRTPFRSDLETFVPLPPAEILERTIGRSSPEYYRAEGLRSYSEFRDAIERHRPLRSIRRMLDWGCGGGRNTVHFLADDSVPEVHGCDIDGESVEWCRDSLPAGHFEQAPPEPPTSYDDGFFDLVIGCSVFTHLTEPMQQAWLGELRRILAPGGLLVVSVHGDFAASLHFQGADRWRRQLKRLRLGTATARGFDDLGEDPRLGTVAPPGYYRAVFQTRRYTMRHWSRTLEILDYIPAGMHTYQDLVVLRRPDEPSQSRATVRT